MRAKLSVLRSGFQYADNIRAVPAWRMNVVQWLIKCQLSFRILRLAWLSMLLVLLASVGAHAENVPIRLTLDREIDGTVSPFLAAQRAKSYRRERLDVSIIPGSGSRQAIRRVASGEYQFGVADISQLVRYIAQNPDAPVQAVMLLEDRPAYAIIGRKSKGVIVPKDLEGKALGVTPPDPAFAHWSAFARANTIDEERVRLESRGYVLRETGLAQGRVDAIVGQSHSSPVKLKQLGVPAEDLTIIPMTTGGVDLFGNALIVNLDFAEKNPAAARGFVAATIAGFFQVIADPVGHANDVLHYNGEAAQTKEVERIERFINGNVTTARVRAHGLGGIDMGRLTRSIRMLKSTYGLEDAPIARRVFTWNYLPPREDRKIPDRGD